MLNPWIHFSEISPTPLTSRAVSKAHPTQHRLTKLWAQILGSRMGMPQKHTLLAETSS